MFSTFGQLRADNNITDEQEIIGHNEYFSGHILKEKFGTLDSLHAYSCDEKAFFKWCRENLNPLVCTWNLVYLCPTTNCIVTINQDEFGYVYHRNKANIDVFNAIYNRQKLQINACETS